MKRGLEIQYYLLLIPQKWNVEIEPLIIREIVEMNWLNDENHGYDHCDYDEMLH